MPRVWNSDAASAPSGRDSDSGNTYTSISLNSASKSAMSSGENGTSKSITHGDEFDFEFGEDDSVAASTLTTSSVPDSTPSERLKRRKLDQRLLCSLSSGASAAFSVARPERGEESEIFSGQSIVQLLDDSEVEEVPLVSSSAAAAPSSVKYHKRPVGRGPKGKVWDTRVGEFIEEDEVFPLMALVSNSHRASSVASFAASSSAAAAASSSVPYYVRPRGRAPTGKGWDSVQGQWIDQASSSSDISTSAAVSSSADELSLWMRRQKTMRALLEQEDLDEKVLEQEEAERLLAFPEFIEPADIFGENDDHDMGQPFKYNKYGDISGEWNHWGLLRWQCGFCSMVRPSTTKKCWTCGRFKQTTQQWHDDGLDDDNEYTMDDTWDGDEDATKQILRSQSGDDHRRFIVRLSLERLHSLLPPGQSEADINEGEVVETRGVLRGVLAFNMIHDHLLWGFILGFV